MHDSTRIYKIGRSHNPVFPLLLSLTAEKQKLNNSQGATDGVHLLSAGTWVPISVSCRLVWHDPHNEHIMVVSLENALTSRFLWGTPHWTARSERNRGLAGSLPFPQAAAKTMTRTLLPPGNMYLRSKAKKAAMCWLRWETGVGPRPSEIRTKQIREEPQEEMMNLWMKVARY